MGEPYFVFILRTSETLGEGVFEEVDGQPVLIPGFEELDLFLHHPHGLGGKSELWAISEGTTGMSVAGHAISQEQAESYALDKLRFAGLERVKEVIAERLEKEVHRSPRCS